MSAKTEFESLHNVSFEKTAWGSWEVQLPSGARYSWSEKLDRVFDGSGRSVEARSVTPDFETAPTSVEVEVEASSGFKHGSRYGYQAKRCRCEGCVQWNRDRNAMLYQRRKNRQPKIGF